MIESKLSKAAQNLSEPVSDFALIEEKATKDRQSRAYSYRKGLRKPVLIACILLLLGCTTIAASTEINYGAWAKYSSNFEDATAIADTAGITLPENMAGSPFYEMVTLYNCKPGTTYLDALINPAYKWYSIDYCKEENVSSQDPSDGSEIVYCYTKDNYELAFGPTDNDLYRYVFCLDENNTATFENAIPGSIQTSEYNGIHLQMMTRLVEDKESIEEVDGVRVEHYFYIHSIQWLDAEKHVVFQIDYSAHVPVTPDSEAKIYPGKLVELAKELIDLNR